MKTAYRLLIVLIIFSGCSMITPLQRSNLIAVFHLIEISNYEEAKTVIEEMIMDNESREWSRTWYARGLLTQTAYREGKKDKKKKFYQLYDDQLYVSYSSYERARMLDNRGRLDRQLAPRYVLLANDLQKLGEEHFKAEEYNEALRAFEKALVISQHSILSLPMDTNLIYNTALAAYESHNKEKAIEYLTLLHKYGYSTDVSHLLYDVHLENGDTLKGNEVLHEGIAIYDDPKNLVLLLSDAYFARNDTLQAVNLLDSVAKLKPDEYIYPYTKGLVLQKAERYQQAIESYKKAVEIAPDQLMIYANIATCYFNIGVEIEEQARSIMISSKVDQEQARSQAAFKNAVQWLDKAYAEQPDDRELLNRLYQIYKVLNVNEKVNELESRLK